MRYVVGLLIVVFSLSAASVLLACPRCAAGEQARRAVWRQDFVYHLAATSLPFLLVAAASVGAEALERSMARRRSARAFRPNTSHPHRRLKT